jgi:hypothetical protein
VTQAQFLLDWANDAIIPAFLVSLLFPVIVAPYYRWWSNEFGWNLSIKSWVIAIALLPSFVHRVFGVPVNVLAFMYMVVVAITTIPIVLIWRAWAIYKTQRAGAITSREREVRGTDTTKIEGGDEHDGHKATGRQ